MRLLYATLAFLSLMLALIGAILPLVPTVPFLLVATFFSAKSSERLHNWLLTHRAFGPMIQDWQSRGAIRPAAKKAATLSIAAVFLVSLFFGAHAHVLAIQAVVLTAVLTFIWTRPTA